jgi:hypothetical protein
MYFILSLMVVKYNFNAKQRVAFDNVRKEKESRLQAEIERLRAEAKAREDLSSFTL